jgi:hypothetical protein
MTEAVTITNEELAILCDIVTGWNVRRTETLDADKRQALDRLITNGFVEPADEISVTKYTAKTELLFAQLAWRWPLSNPKLSSMLRKFCARRLKRFIPRGPTTKSCR